MMRTVLVSLGIALAAVMASCSRDASRESTASCSGARRDHHCALRRGRRQRCAEPNDCQCPSRAEARARQSARRESAAAAVRSATPTSPGRRPIRMRWQP